MRRGPVVELPSSEAVPASVIASLLDLLEQPILISDRAAESCRPMREASSACLDHGFAFEPNLNLFSDLLRIHPESNHRADRGRRTANRFQVRMLRRRGDRAHSVAAGSGLAGGAHRRSRKESSRRSSRPATQHTVQELLQEREITYRNLLAAYLRLQEVNRQKTVFLASAAHELKTPLAVIKGYYDLLLSGSLGQTDRQAARHPAGIQGKLRAAGAPGFDVPELFGAGKRQAGAASARK